MDIHEQKLEAVSMFINAKTEADMLAATSRCIELGMMVDLGESKTVLGGKMRTFEITDEGQDYFTLPSMKPDATSQLIAQAANREHLN